MLTVNTWDGNNINDGTNFEAGFSPGMEWGLPDVGVHSLERSGAWPVIGGIQRGQVTISLFVGIIDSSSVLALRGQLLSWFDPEDGEPKQLIITDDGTAHPRYIEAICQRIRPVTIGSIGCAELFRIELVVHDDVRWRATSDTEDVWNITASGQTNVVAVAGETEVYPVYKFKPTSAGGGYAYRRWVPIKWLSENAGPQYPLRAELDTATLVTAAKMQADGDDLRVLLDGTETDRWLNDMNTGATGIWFNVNFTRAPALVLKTAIAGVGDIASIEFTDEVEVSLISENGIILIDSEAFTYTARNLLDASVTGITRAAKGTSLAVHGAASTCYWIQHDVYLIYGNAGAAAPVVDDDYKPMFTLANSTNVLWYYEYFGDSSNKRSGRWGGWGPITDSGNAGRYTETGFNLADPFTVIGAWESATITRVPGWYLENPCGIVNAAWADGKKRALVKEDFLVHLMYWIRGESYWTWQATLVDPLADDTWEDWSEAAAGADWEPAYMLAIALYTYASYAHTGTVTVNLNASEVPVVTVNAEQGNYLLNGTLTNEATDESITLEFVMDLNSELEIDTKNRVVTWLKDGSRQLQSLSKSSVRRHWLRLLLGNNTLRFDDADTGDITITTTFPVRFY